jgi:hypothetical protein
MLLEPPEPTPVRWWLVLLAALGLAAVAIAAWLLAASRDGTDEVPDSSSPGQGSTSAPPGQVTTSSTFTLVEATYDAVFLLYPSLLPEGFELCRALDDSQAGDRFCPSPTADSWIQVAVEDPTVARLGQGTAIPEAHGAVWLRRVGQPLEIGVAVDPRAKSNEHYHTKWGQNS